MSLKEVKLPSGAVLKITPSPFVAARALYQAVLEEIKQVQIVSRQDVLNVLKDVLCQTYTSKKIESCLNECLKRCTYNSGNGDLKIDDNTFEPLEARGDYTVICLEVTQENIAPFVPGLSVALKRFSLMIPENLT